eukprot:CAMPEP_0167757220 /NCGR_PEP_ID=MMETSP0110_2-20121227/9806_1 /TAXON_ID=629695 /ORGANISM="Gymnochlora sp., Strain CCMP2014" /LENGTH=213 /DNA_ID=CAMNT_0007643389 /DNA_START=107 /DNA_END=745 /DNA_ORIENTATION=+
MDQDRRALMNRIRKRPRGESVKKALKSSLGSIIDSELKHCSFKGFNFGYSKSGMSVETFESPKKVGYTENRTVENSEWDEKLTDEELDSLLKLMEDQLQEDPEYQMCLMHEKEETEAINAEVEQYFETQGRDCIICPVCRKSYWEFKQDRNVTWVRCSCGLKIKTPSASKDVFRKYLGNAFNEHSKRCMSVPQIGLCRRRKGLAMGCKTCKLN